MLFLVKGKVMNQPASMPNRMPYIKFSPLALFYRYYMKAADHMKARQKNCLNFPIQALPFVPSAPVDGEFYGQLILNVPAAASDIPIALYLQNCERAVNHTAWMVHLLKSAITQFKRHRCLRTALMLFNRLGDEYCDIGAYEKAQSLFAQGLAEYRKSKWSVVFSRK